MRGWIIGLNLLAIAAIAASCASVSEPGSSSATTPTATPSKSATPTPALPQGVLSIVYPPFKPSGLLYAYGSLWAEDHAATGKLYRLNPSSGEVTGEWDLARPCDVAAGFGSIWVADLDAGTLLRIDPDNGDTQATITGLAAPCGPQTAGNAVWVGVADGLAKIDPGSESVTRTIGESMLWPGSGGPPLWTSEGGTDRLVKVDARTSRTIGIAELSAPTDLAMVLVADGDVWASNRDSGLIQRFDVRSGKEVASIAVQGPDRMALVNGTLWVTSYSRGRLYGIDPGTDELVVTLELGGNINGIAATPGGIWVADTMGRLLLIDAALRR